MRLPQCGSDGTEQSCQYVNTRDFNDDVAGDSGPEGIEFVASTHSPNGQPLLLVGNEVSRTMAVFSITRVRR